MYLKINFLISQLKHMLWVLKRTISMRLFYYQNQMFKLMDKKILQFFQKIFFGLSQSIEKYNIESLY